MTATRGPVPKRSGERRRRNKTSDSGVSNEVEHIIVDPAVLEDTSLVPAPAANPDWHPIARMVYESAKRSAIRDFYEPTDWAQLFVICETISANLNEQPVLIQQGPRAGEIEWIAQPMTGATLSGILKGLNDLMFNEGTRRRLRLEFERVPSSGETIAQPTADNVVAFRAGRLAR